MTTKSQSRRSASPTRLRRRRKQILAEMEKITDLLQGSLTEQYLTRRNARGRKYKAGPYYVRTWYADGKKHTERISRTQVPRVRKQIRNYQKMKTLFDELLNVTERLTHYRESIWST